MDGVVALTNFKTPAPAPESNSPYTTSGMKSKALCRLRWFISVTSAGSFVCLSCVGPPPEVAPVENPGLDPQVRQYWEIKAAASTDEFTAYEATPDSLKPDWVRRFWKSKDPTPATPENEFLTEHGRRVDYALQHYGHQGKGRPWDDRGEMYIRYGEPDEIEMSDEGFYDPGAPKSAIELRDNPIAAKQAATRRGTGAETSIGGDPLFATSIERWYYSRYGLSFQFQPDLATGLVEAVPYVSTDRGQVQTAREFVNSTEIRHEIYQHDYGGDFLPYTFSIARFRGPARNWEVDVNLALPLEKLALAGPDTNEVSCLRRMVIFDQAWHEVALDSTVIVKEVERYRRRGKLLVEQKTFQVPPGLYTLSVEVRDLITRKVGIYKKPLLLPEYAAPDVQEVSDVVLASYVKPAEPSSLAFVRNGWVVMPQPSRVFFPDDPLAFYFEVYNLRRGPDGKTHVKVGYEVVDFKSKKKIVTPLPQALVSDSTDLVRTGTVDIKTLPPGDYILAVRVVDETTRKEKSALASFRIVKG